MPVTKVQDQWVFTVLGVSRERSAATEKGQAIGRAASAPIDVSRTAAPKPIRFLSVEGRAIWEQARTSVADQVAPLQTRLMASDDPDMQNIATRVYSEFMERLGTTMLAAMVELDAATPDTAVAARRAAKSAVADQRGRIDADPLIDLLERNPFDVPIKIRSTLGDALTQIEQAIPA